MKDDLSTLKARAKNWPPAAGGVKKWGENSIDNYNRYVDFLVTNGVLKAKIDASELVTNELIDEINKFDQADIEKQAKGYKG
jgi:NitT/TauT family transport system substrate-binding protein